MQNGSGYFKIRFRRLLISEHSMRDQRQVNPAQPLRCAGKHLWMRGGVVEIHDPGVDGERSAGQQVLSYCCQPIRVSGDEHEVPVGRRELPNGGNGYARGRSQHQYPGGEKWIAFRHGQLPFARSWS
jgi:hypothetical protein